MTRDEVYKLIEDNGLTLHGDIEHFAALVAEHERKEYAKLCDEPVTILPDGSAFGVMSFPLPSDHWLYAPNEYRDGEYEPIDLPKPILTHAVRDVVVAAVRYAVRGATMRGQETDFDPDALVQNAVYALCGPYTTPPAQPAPVQKRPQNCGTGYCSCIECVMEPAPVQEPVAYLCENAVGHKYFRWKKPPSTYKPIALYTTPCKEK